MYFHDLTDTCAHLSYDNATVQLLEEALMESDQHVVKAAFLVEIEAVGSCCIFLGTWMLYPEPDTAVIKTTWVLLWILEHGNLSGWRVVASGWKLVVSGICRWSPWNLGLVETVGWSITRRHSCILLHPGFIFRLGSVNDAKSSPSRILKAQTWWVQSSQNTQLRKEHVVNFWVHWYLFNVRECGIFVFSFIALNVWIWWKASFFVCCSFLESSGGYLQLVMLAPDKSRSSLFFYPQVFFFFW